MTRETKIGMLVGMGVIVLIGILISDHLSLAQQQDEAHLLGGQAAADQPTHQSNPPSLQRNDPLPLPQSTGAGGAVSPPAGQRNIDPAPTDPAMTGQVRHRLYPAAQQDDRPADPSMQQADLADQGNRLSVDELTMGQAAESPVDQQPRLMDTQRPAGDRVHHVQAGETLYEIAKQYYDDGNYWRTIYEANRDKMASADRLRKGVRLVIPNRSGRAQPIARTSGAADAASRPVATPRYTTHKVARGETLSEIAQRYFGTVRKLDALVALNEQVIDDPNDVPAGVVLRVPATTP
jgi:nucleoid-associated protein YgaU